MGRFAFRHNELHQILLETSLEFGCSRENPTSGVKFWLSLDERKQKGRLESRPEIR